MLDKLIGLLPNQKQRDVASMAGAMGLLLAGQKLPALLLFAKGQRGLEKQWKSAHPDVHGFDARWQAALDFYEKTHKDETNRKLHIVGIPMILGGTVGLIVFPAFRPMWLASASSFTVGWILNFIGHGFFEKNAPAFADDPLSFFAGPVWDLQQLFGKKLKRETVSTPHGDVAVFSVDPSEPAQA